MKKLIFLLLFILCLTSVSAATYQSNTTIDLKHPIRVDGAIIASSCNITVYSPNKTILIDFEEMTDNGNYHNFSINNSLVTPKGEYTYDVTCISGNVNGTESFSFLVNPTGIEPTAQRTDTITRAVYFIFGIGILLFIGFLFVGSSTPVKWSFFIAAIIFFLIGINIIFISLQDEIVNPKLETFFESFTVISWYLYWFAAGLLIIIWAFTFLNTWLLKKNMQRWYFLMAKVFLQL